MVGFLQADLRSAIRFSLFISSIRPDFEPDPFRPSRVSPPPRLRAFSNGSVAGNLANDKPNVCTADELHYVSVDNSPWRLALWRYNATPQGTKRNHPLLLLSGVGTNATGYDLAPGCSFARHMASEGFDTWILELRGAGLSVEDSLKADINHHQDAQLENVSNAEDNERETVLSNVDEPQLNVKWRNNLVSTFERLSNSLIEGVPDGSQGPNIVDQPKDLSQRLVDILSGGQKSVSPRFRDFQWRLSSVLDFQKQIDLIMKYNWDFDHYLEEDVPAAMEYIRTQCKPEDGKLLAIGHSMGGILLYAMLSRDGQEGRDSKLASVVTLGSSLDYTTSRSSLKLLLPLANPAQALKVPVIPLGTLLAAAYPLATRPPFVLSWLNPLISAPNMMHPELFEKLILNNFCTISGKLLLQLATAFQGGGLCDRSGKVFYKDNLHKSNVPVLALAGDQDSICPPEAVYETAKLFSGELIKFKVFGEPNGPHYAHYDLVGGRLAAEQVYPCIIDFLSQHDHT